MTNIIRSVSVLQDMLSASMVLMNVSLNVIAVTCISRTLEAQPLAAHIPMKETQHTSMVPKSLMMLRFLTITNTTSTKE